MKLYQLRSIIERKLSRKEVEEWLKDDEDDITEDPNSVKNFSGSSDASRVLNDVRKCLVYNGVNIDINEQTPDGAVAVAEAVNLAAKRINGDFYNIKPDVIVSAALMGASLWYNDDDYTWSLYSKGIGTASFHDPNDEIYYLVEKYDIPVKKWDYGWSGVARQENAFDLLKSPKLRKRLADLTRPRKLIQHPELEKQEIEDFKKYLKHFNWKNKNEMREVQ